jgi:hypothetical protein
MVGQLAQHVGTEIQREGKGDACRASNKVISNKLWLRRTSVLGNPFQVSFIPPQLDPDNLNFFQHEF